MRYVAVDTETYLIQPGRLAPRLVCVSYWDSSSQDGTVLNREDGVRFVTALLKDEDVILVGHNIAFDMAVLITAGVPGDLIWKAYDDGRIYCTMIREKLRKIARGWYEYNPAMGNQRTRFSLAALVQEYLSTIMTGKKGTDVWRLRYCELDGVPVSEYPPKAFEYALKDAKYTARVCAAQRKSDPEIPDFHRQCGYSWSLHLMSVWGLRTDPIQVETVASRVQTAVDAASVTLRKHGILNQDGSKNTATIKALLVRRFGMVDVPRTAPTDRAPQGNIKTDKATLEESEDPVLMALAGISGDEKILSTYVPLLRQGIRAPVTPQYDLVRSGRTSAFRPNIQNQPRVGGVRECFIPRDGYAFVGADYHAAELCSLAQVLLDRYGASQMAKAIQEGRELHLETAAGILGITYEEAVERHKAHDREVKDARQLAKAANFGFPGGLGAETFVAFAKAIYGLDLSVQEAKDLKAVWLERYPEMARYFQDMGSRCNQGGGSFTAIQHRSDRIRGDCHFTSGCNTFFQGLTADGAKRALYEVAKECYTAPESPLYGSHPVAFIHDEIILETPLDKITGAAERLSLIMETAMEQFTPDIPSSATAAAMMRWYKDAEPAFDEAGKLIPWEPKK